MEKTGLEKLRGLNTDGRMKRAGTPGRLVLVGGTGFEPVTPAV